MKKESYILLLTGIVIMVAGLLIFSRVSVGEMLLSGFIGGVLLVSSVVINIANQNRHSQRKLAYVRAR